MNIAALDFEFNFPKAARPWDYTRVQVVCGVLTLADGTQIRACPLQGRPFSLLEPYLRSNLTIFVHHAHAEWNILRALNLPVPVNFIDTETAARFLDIRDRGFLRFRYDLLSCMERAGLPVRRSWLKDDMQQRIAKGDISDLKAILDYCADDTTDTLKLAQTQISKLDDHFLGLIQPLQLKLLEIHGHGLCVDVEFYTQVQQNAELILNLQQKRLKSIGYQGQFDAYEKLTAPMHNMDVQRTLMVVGREDILDDLPVFMQDEWKLGWQRKSMAGLFKLNVNNEFIQAAKEYHATLDLIRYDWRTFIDSDSRIRFGFSFPGSSSCRISPRCPHPLQLPKMFRPVLTANPGCVLVEIDFSGQEFGLAGAWFNDQRMIEIFNNYNKSLYAEIGQAIGQYPTDDPETDPEQLDRTKTAVLALSYGAGVPALKKNLSCSEDTALSIIRSFKSAFPGLQIGRKQYFDAVQATDSAWNVIGLRRKYVPYKPSYEVGTELSFLNFPVQSGGAMVMARLIFEMPAWIKIVATCHDAVLIECPKDAAEEVTRIASAVMINANDNLFPALKCRVKSQYHWRFYKKSPASLHEFCNRLGVNLTAPISQP